MSRFLSISVVLMCIIIFSGSAFSWPFQLPVNVILLPPPPGQMFIEDLWRIQVDNPTEETFHAYLYMEISESYEGLIARAESGDFYIPPGVKILSSSEISPIDADFFNSEYETIVGNAGSFPAGNYTVILILYDYLTGEPIGEGEFYQYVENPSPPELITPFDEESIEDSYSTIFSWLPPVPAGLEIRTYNIRVVEILEGQNKTQAITSNPAWFEEQDLLSTSLVFPISARTFENGSQYAWQVEAFNQGSVSIGSSEIWSFYYSGGSDLFETEPGEEKWSFQCSDIISCSPAVGDDWSVYFGCNDGNVFSIGPNGVERWRYSTGGSVYGISLSPDGTVFASGVFGVCAMDPLGSLLWHNRDMGVVNGAPSVSSSNRIYVGGESGAVHSINADNGEVIWQFDAEGPVRSGVTIGSNEMVFFGSSDENLYGLNISDGSLVWSFKTDEGFESPLSIDRGGTVYAGCKDGTLYALNSESGEALWGFESSGEITSGAVIAFGGVIYVGTSDGFLYLVDGSTGREIRRFGTNGTINSTPAIAAMGTIFFGSFNGKLYAVSPVGTEDWNFETDGMIRTSPAIGVDGTVYFGSDDKKFYAISSSETGLAFSPWPKYSRDNRNSGNSETGGETQ